MLIAPIRGWCNRQHNRFWPCHWGFESSPPSQPERELRSSLAPSSSGLGRRPLKAVTAVRICSGLPEARDLVPGFVASGRRARRARAGYPRPRARAARRWCPTSRGRRPVRAVRAPMHTVRRSGRRVGHDDSGRCAARCALARVRAARGDPRVNMRVVARVTSRDEIFSRHDGAGAPSTADHRVTTARETRRGFAHEMSTLRAYSPRERTCAHVASHHARVVARERDGGNA